MNSCTLQTWCQAHSSLGGSFGRSWRPHSAKVCTLQFISGHGSKPLAGLRLRRKLKRCRRIKKATPPQRFVRQRAVLFRNGSHSPGKLFILGLESLPGSRSGRLRLGCRCRHPMRFCGSVEGMLEMVAADAHSRPRVSRTTPYVREGVRLLTSSPKKNGPPRPACLQRAGSDGPVSV